MISPLEVPRGPSLLETDGYKFSMSEAGAPLRDEDFYLSFRKGGWQYLPVDVEKFIRDRLPVATPADYAYLDTHGYFQGGAYRAAVQMHDQVRVKGLPKGSWFHEREPVLLMGGPSALPSWTEPLGLQLHFRIQVATAALLRPDELARKVAKLTCEAERQIVLETLDSVHVAAPPMEVCAEEYAVSVRRRVDELVRIVGDPNRLFEVGMRAVSCSEQHRIALEQVRDAGILRTSNVALAAELGMIPVGTMGHEHIQRHGSDYAAYVAMRDKFPGFIFYLPDTFDTMASGVPSALAAMLDDPLRNSGIRFDSEHGIRGHYLYTIAKAREVGLTPLLGLESGWNAKLTREFEELRELVHWPADRQGYGYGGYMVRPEWPHFGRDDVAAVWKITRSGRRNTMKFGDEPMGGKSSIPGRPVLWRPHLGMSDYRGPLGYVAQDGEDWRPPVPASLVSGQGLKAHLNFRAAEIRGFHASGPALVLSPATQALVAQCTAERADSIALASTVLSRS